MCVFIYVYIYIYEGYKYFNFSTYLSTMSKVKGKVPSVTGHKGTEGESFFNPRR